VSFELSINGFIFLKICKYYIRAVAEEQRKLTFRSTCFLKMSNYNFMNTQFEEGVFDLFRVIGFEVTTFQEIVLKQKR